MFKRGLLLVTIVALVVLAGCSSQSAGTSDDPIEAESNGTPEKLDAETFYIDTERGTYFCIYSESSGGYSGYVGLSCELIGNGGG